MGNHADSSTEEVASSWKLAATSWEEELAAASCAVQNMHLAACAYGVAGYWSSGGTLRGATLESITPGPVDRPAVKTFLSLRPQDRCLGVFLCGKSDRVEKYRGSRGPWEEQVTWHLG